MSRDKQIEEMAKDFCAIKELVICEECHLYKNRCHAKKYATRAYNAGYRKSSEVAEEIFEEVGEIINQYLDGRIYTHDFCTYLAELKKKYIGKDTNVTTNTEGGE